MNYPDDLRMAVKEVICDGETERPQYEEALIAITVDESLKRWVDVCMDLLLSMLRNSLFILNIVIADTASALNDLIFGEASQNCW